MRFTQLIRPLSRWLRPAPAPPPARIVTTPVDDPAPAVQQLEDGPTLRQLAGLTGIDSSGPLSPARAGSERAARARVAQLIDAGRTDFGALLTATGPSAALLSVAALCKDPAQLARAFAAIDDPRRIEALVIEGSSSRIRQLAAQRIEDPAQLKDLLRQLRGKDKNVYKIIKQKCDRLNAEEQHAAQLRSETQALCEALERHSRRPYEPLYPASLRQFEAQWLNLEAAAPQARERVQQALARCREVIAAHERHVAEQAAAQARRLEIEAERRAAGARAALDAQERSAATALAAAAAAAAHAVEQQAQAEKAAAEAQALRQISALIGKTHAALRDGQTGRAAGLRRAVDEKLAAAAAVPAHLAGQVQQLDLKLNELKEWKEHAVAPKRAELIAEMESLSGSSEEPPALAERIKQLQEDWKTISKGITSDSEADWQRFHTASQAAYQPCREYFERQAALRRENLERRAAVLERLRAFEAQHTSTQPDWRTVMTVLREAPREWRQHAPVERSASLPLQQEFDAVLERLQGGLDAWQAANAADKAALIQRAQRLVDGEDGREAVEAVKQMQLQWKRIGPARRESEQTLWQQFREHCDAVYQKRQQAHADYSAALEANKAQALALCEAAERVAALAGAALLEGAANATEWRTAFESLGDMPRADERGLHERFERALQRCESQVAQQRTRDREQSFTHLFEAAGLIRDYGWALAQGAPDAERDALKQAAETFIAGVPQWPKGGAQALEDAWANAAAADAGSEAAHERALRLLCIRAEIASDAATPPADQALRREYQVQRLMQRMGQGGDSGPSYGADDLDALALEWARVGPLPGATQAPLLARFLRHRPARG